MNWWRACLVAVAIAAAVVGGWVVLVTFSVDVPPITRTNIFPGTDKPPVKETEPATTRSCRSALDERVSIDTEDGPYCLDGAIHRIRIAELVLAVPALGALGTYAANFIRRRRSRSQPDDNEPVSFAAGVVAGAAVAALAWLLSAVDVSVFVVVAIFAAIVLVLLRTREHDAAAGVIIGTASGLVVLGLLALSRWP